MFKSSNSQQLFSNDNWLAPENIAIPIPAEALNNILLLLWVGAVTILYRLQCNCCFPTPPLKYLHPKPAKLYALKLLHMCITFGEITTQGFLY